MAQVGPFCHHLWREILLGRQENDDMRQTWTMPICDAGLWKKGLWSGLSGMLRAEGRWLAMAKLGFVFG